MGKSNSDFGDVIVWGLGIFALTKIFGKDEEKLGQASKKIEVYKFKELPTISEFIPRDKVKDKNGKPLIVHAITEIDYELDPTLPIKNKDGSYSIRVKNFEIKVRTTMNTDPSLEWKNISDFKKYYKDNRDYVYEDVDTNDFYTKEGTAFHESLHRKVARDSFNKYKNDIERDISRLKSKDPNWLYLEATKILKEYKNKIITEFGDEEDHKRIILDTWKNYKLMYDRQILKKDGIRGILV